TGTVTTICESIANCTVTGRRSSVTSGRLPKFAPLIVSVSPLGSGTAPVTVSGGACASANDPAVKNTTTINAETAEHAEILCLGEFGEFGVECRLIAFILNSEF